MVFPRFRVRCLMFTSRFPVPIFPSSLIPRSSAGSQKIFITRASSDFSLFSIPRSQQYINAFLFKSFGFAPRFRVNFREVVSRFRFPIIISQKINSPQSWHYERVEFYCSIQLKRWHAFAFLKFSVFGYNKCIKEYRMQIGRNP